MNQFVAVAFLALFWIIEHFITRSTKAFRHVVLIFFFCFAAYSYWSITDINQKLDQILAIHHNPTTTP